jgi:imidazolonepropionase
MIIWKNARLATMAANDRSLGIIESGFIASDGKTISQVGDMRQWRTDLERDGNTIVDCQGRLITPGLIDCHTHIAWAGSRANEFEQRLTGKTYAEIAQSGGGIQSTVRAVQATSIDEIVAQSTRRLASLAAEGVTTVEIKSGYGLDLVNEIKQLRAAALLGPQCSVSVIPTYLALHALPVQFKTNHQAFVDQVCQEFLPEIAGQKLCAAVDAFCEGIAFSPSEVEQLFRAARELGLPVKLHADQLSNTNAASLAARWNALSADHLEYTDDAGAMAMSKSSTVAVLLPGAYYCLRETQLPPIESFRKHAVPMAVATDCNPGTSPMTSLLLAMNMAATLFRMTVDECLLGVTRNAARALGMLDQIGTLETGKQCDLAIWNVCDPSELVYRVGYNSLHQRIWRGQCTHQR